MGKQFHSRGTSWSAHGQVYPFTNDEMIIEKWARSGKGKPNRQTRRAMERDYRKREQKGEIG